MKYEYGKMIGEGGEAKVYEVKGNSDLLIKEYKDKNSQGNPIVTSELQQKMEFMLQHPFMSSPNKGYRLAWPVDIVYKNGKMAGFVMPKLKSDISLLQVYSYKHPLIDKTYNQYPSVQSRIGVAINLALAISDVHKAGYVIGDLNPENIGINRSTAQIQIFDCDSFTVTDTKINHTYRTNACRPGYVAPEIIRYCNSERAKSKPSSLCSVALPTFTKESDLFCLAIHIFRSIMNGVFPFLGISNTVLGSKASPLVDNDGILKNNYVFKSGYHPSAVFCLSKNEIPKDIKNLFDRTFLDGNTNPAKRPSAEDWHGTLVKYLGSLRQCSKNTNHQYYNQLSYCPFCKADEEHYKTQTGGAKQPSTKFNYQSVPRPIIFPNYTQQQQSQNQQQIQKKQKKIPSRKITGIFWNVVGVIAVIICILLGISKNDESDSSQKSTKTEQAIVSVSQKKLPQIEQNQTTRKSSAKTNTRLTTLPDMGETFSRDKYYVTTRGLNARSGPGIEYDSLFVIPQNNVVYLSTLTASKSGAWRKAKYINGKTSIGWVNTSFLRNFQILDIQIGNHDNEGKWINRPSNDSKLYSEQIEHLGVNINFETNSNNPEGESVRLYMKIITSSNTYIQGKNVPQGYSEVYNINIKKSGYLAYGTFNIPYIYYYNKPGTWKVEFYYSTKNEYSFDCIASKTFILY